MGVVGRDQQFTRLAHGALATGRRADPMGRGPHIRHGIGHGQRQSGAAHDRQVRQIVAHAAGLLWREAQFGQQGFEVQFLVAAVEVQIFNPQVAQAGGDRRGWTPADRSRGNARSLQALQTETVMDVHGLDFCIVRAQIQFAVGHDAIDIENHDTDARRALANIVGNVVHISLAFSRSCMFSAPMGRLSSSTTISAPPPMRFSRSRRMASAASMSGGAVTGSQVMWLAMPACLISTSVSSVRRRSPSVYMPARRPSASITPVMPSPLEVISSSASRTLAWLSTSGISAPLCMMSATVSNNLRPSMPPGCERAKSSAVKARAS